MSAYHCGFLAVILYVQEATPENDNKVLKESLNCVPKEIRAARAKMDTREKVQMDTFRLGVVKCSKMTISVGEGFIVKAGPSTSDGERSEKHGSTCASKGGVIHTYKYMHTLENTSVDGDTFHHSHADIHSRIQI